MSLQIMDKSNIMKMYVLFHSKENNQQNGKKNKKKLWNGRNDLQTIYLIKG